MTWARNYGNRRSAASSQGGKRAKPPKICVGCGTGIFGIARKWCMPCYAGALRDRGKANAKRVRLAKKAKNGGAA